MAPSHDLVRTAYAAFNARDIPAVLATLHPRVRWSKAWEGGYATGHDEVRAYWQRQWQEVDPRVEPTGFRDREDGRLEVAVHQVVRGLQGQVLFDGPVTHVYTLRDGLFQQLDIELG